MKQKFVSTVIIGILGVQLLVVFYHWGQRLGDGLWPFINYPMYHGIHREGERLDPYYPVFAQFEDSTEKQLSPNDLGLSVFKFQTVFVAAIYCVAGRAKPADIKGRCRPTEGDRLKELLDRYEHRAGQQVVRLRVEDYRLILTREGAKEAPVTTVADLDLR